MSGNMYCLAGPCAGVQFKLDSKPLVIGRSKQISDIVLPAKSAFLSGKHVAVWYDRETETYFIEPLTNKGVFTETGVRLKKGIPFAFKPGGKFHLANSKFIFEFRDEYTQTVQSVQTVSSNEVVLVDMSYAEIWKRGLAYLIDAAILGIPLTIFVSLVVYDNVMIIFAAKNVFDLMVGNMISLGLYTLCIVLPWLYYSILESSYRQATIGKMAVKIKVSTLDNTKVSFSTASARYWCKLISGLILGLGFLMPHFTKRKQALHDYLSECVVINDAEYLYNISGGPIIAGCSHTAKRSRRGQLLRVWASKLRLRLYDFI